ADPQGAQLAPDEECTVENLFHGFAFISAHAPSHKSDMVAQLGVWSAGRDWEPGEIMRRLACNGPGGSFSLRSAWPAAIMSPDRARSAPVAGRPSAFWKDPGAR